MPSRVCGTDNRAGIAVTMIKTGSDVQYTASDDTGPILASSIVGSPVSRPHNARTQMSSPVNGLDPTDEPRPNPVGLRANPVLGSHEPKDPAAATNQPCGNTSTRKLHHLPRGRLSLPVLIPPLRRPRPLHPRAVLQLNRRFHASRPQIKTILRQRVAGHRPRLSPSIHPHFPALLPLHVLPVDVVFPQTPPRRSGPSPAPSSPRSTASAPAPRRD